MGYGNLEPHPRYLRYGRCCLKEGACVGYCGEKLSPLGGHVGIIGRVMESYGLVMDAIKALGVKGANGGLT